jgi:hypothetical protein
MTDNYKVVICVGKVSILNTDGSRVGEIIISIFNNNLLYNERNDQLLIRQNDRLCCINLNGHVIYKYEIFGGVGLAVTKYKNPSFTTIN